MTFGDDLEKEILINFYSEMTEIFLCRRDPFISGYMKLNERIKNLNWGFFGFKRIKLMPI